MYWLKFSSWPAAASSFSIRAHMASRTCRNSRPRLDPLQGAIPGDRSGEGVFMGRHDGCLRNSCQCKYCEGDYYTSRRCLHPLEHHLQHELAAEEGQHQQGHRAEGPAHRHVAAPAAPPAAEEEGTE